MRFLLAALTCAGLVSAASAETAVKIGVLNDRSGIYGDFTGEGSVVAARMAVGDFKDLSRKREADPGVELVG